ncbi:histidine kinase N-terminal 7TM domain-containing protein [Kineococcus sp. NUM-3379]
MEHVVLPAFLLATVLSAAVGATAWRRRGRVRAADALAGLMAAVTIWCAAAVALRVPWAGEGVRYVAWWLTFASVSGVGMTAWFMCRHVVDPAWRSTWRSVGALWAVPALCLAALATNSWHHLVFLDAYDATGAALPRRFGPLLWLYSGYCYLVSAHGLWMLWRARRRAPWYERRRLTSLLLAPVPPLVVGSLGLFAGDVLGGQDHTPLGFVVSGLVYAHALFRQGFLSVAPVARTQVLERIPDAVTVVDAGGTVVDMNAEARRMMSVLHPELPGDPIGRRAEDISPGVMRPLGPGGESNRTLEVAPGWHVSATTSLLTDERGRDLGRVVVLRDVSELVEQRAELLRQQAELAEANARLEEQLRENEELRLRLAEEAVRDPLTGTRNRRWLDATLPAALDAAGRTGSPLSLLVVDVDHFKAVNDTHGHETGDRVLQAVARELAGAVRSGDEVARLGGEEFVVLLPGSGAVEAAERAEELRRRCARLRTRSRDGAVVRVTVSIGVATAPPDGRHPDALLAAADGALYAAKRSGRDRVVAAG